MNVSESNVPHDNVGMKERESKKKGKVEEKKEKKKRSVFAQRAKELVQQQL